MKKIILINVLTLVLTLLLLCGCRAPLNTDTETEDETVDTSTDTSTDSSIDTSTDTSVDTTTDTSTDTEDETVDTSTDTSTDSSIDTSTDTSVDTTTDTSTDTSTEIENPKTPSENTQTVTWQFNYDYGFHHENSATLLIDYGKLIHGFENVIIPDDIVAGDSITIEYTGGISIAESYPSGIYLHDGEVISYSFKYASVVPFSLTKTSIERLREEYDIAEEYVIVDRSGKYQTLEESIGKTIYLVTDQKKVSEHLNNWGFPADKYPISSMFAFNPRDLKVGISPVEPRNEKVVFDLDYHHLSNELIEKEEDKADPTKFYCGYICKDENGNEFIAYAPNLYSYTVLIECTEDKSLAYDWINNVLNQFNPWYSTGRCDVEIDTQDLPNDMILITFPDFDTYFTCQNDLLNKLSVLECVKKIHITYVDAQNGTYFPKNPYVVYADVGSKYHKNDVFTTYDEFTSALGSCIESSVGLQAITKSTFENNYVFVVANWHWRELKISDARLVGNTVYFTNNEFQGKGELHDAMAYENSCVIVVPKDEIGELPENVSVKTVNTTIFVDGLADYGDAEGAIIIALEHFSSSDKQALPEGYIYKAKAVDRKYDYCHYVLIYPEYVGDSDSIVDVWGGGYLYAIDKFTKEVVSVEVLE